MKVANRTHTGKLRPNNQDGCYVAQGAGWALAMVADGMGGHRGGEFASRLALCEMAHRLEGAGDCPDERAILEAVRATNGAIHAAAAGDVALAGMGTTLVLAVLNTRQVLVANVGDSRAYLCDGKALRRVTNDHSLVGELVREGNLTDEQARKHPKRNVITRAVGTQPEVSADLFEVEWSPGDRLLLCSDGLHGELPEITLAGLLMQGDVEQAAAALQTAALDAGGRDNITLVIAQNDGKGGERA